MRSIQKNKPQGADVAKRARPRAVQAVRRHALRTFLRLGTCAAKVQKAELCLHSSARVIRLLSVQNIP